jgi:hypothetical protein
VVRYWCPTALAEPHLHLPPPCARIRHSLVTAFLCAHALMHKVGFSEVPPMQVFVSAFGTIPLASCSGPRWPCDQHSQLYILQGSTVLPNWVSQLKPPTLWSCGSSVALLGSLDVGRGQAVDASPPAFFQFCLSLWVWENCAAHYCGLMLGDMGWGRTSFLNWSKPCWS